MVGQPVEVGLLRALMSYDPCSLADPAGQPSGRILM